jgi:hypothetical protein
MGGTALRAVILTPLLLFGTIYFMFVFYRNCVHHQVISKRDGFWFWGKRDYIEADLTTFGKSGRVIDLSLARWAHWVAYFMFLIFIILGISI